MKREIYVCDRCGKSAETKEEIAELALGDLLLGFTASYYSSSNTMAIYAPNASWRKQWCRKCREEVGCVEEKIKVVPYESTVGVPTLESVIREIVRQENNQ